MPKYHEFQGIAWPTISLFLTTAIIYFFTLDTQPSYSLTLKRFSLLLLHIFCCYAQFTVMHDSAHGAISTTKNWVNNLLGWMSQVWMGPTANFYAFRHMHKQHHAHTNDPIYDPDYWVSHSKNRLSPLGWFFVDAGYWHHYIPQVLPWSYKRSKKEVIIVWCYHLCLIALLMFSIKYGFFHYLFWNWILPSRLSKFLLAFAFDYLPHCQIFIKATQNKYLTTRYLYFSPLVRPIASLIMFYHNYHYSHHINPLEPFYRYSYHFEENKEDFKRRGMEIYEVI